MVEMLLHIGIDTVALNGQGFEVFVENGQSVKKGDLLMKIDVSYLTEHAPSLCSPVLCTDLKENQKVRLLAEGEVKAGEPLFHGLPGWHFQQVQPERPLGLPE